MKVAFDENLPPVMVKVFQTLATQSHILTAEVVTASNYRPHGERGDEHWVKRFAVDGGRVIVTGDTKMRIRDHERAALVESGLITYCFERQWSDVNFFTKSAMLLHWWTRIRIHMDTAAPGSFWIIPFVWGSKDLEDATVDPREIKKRKERSK